MLLTIKKFLFYKGFEAKLFLSALEKEKWAFDVELFKVLLHSYEGEAAKICDIYIYNTLI